MTRRWPFYSTDARLVDTPAREQPNDEPSESPYCECDLEPTMQEEDTRRCSACGKPFIV